VALQLTELNKMKIIRYRADQQIFYGILGEDGRVQRLVGDPFGSQEPDGNIDRMESVEVLSPVPSPRVFGVGLNYVSHIKEGGQETPAMPMLFMKPSTTVIGPEEAIVLPTGSSGVEFEAELAVVIGKTARNLSEAEALSAVLGYTCANDVSYRPVQMAEMAMGCLLMGKGYDTFCPLGPVIATDLDPTNLDMLARVNGTVRQQINTSDLLFSVAHLVSYLSQAMTLLPGDVIITGTPSGVGPMQPGDIVEIEIDGVGILRNHAVAEEAA
jgi:2-keto-4-pentenoate hydratase/2-oxohepta-3-ene-1,7-dioic acid hydratase in catechol pathway